MGRLFTAIALSLVALAFHLPRLIQITAPCPESQGGAEVVEVRLDPWEEYLPRQEGRELRTTLALGSGVGGEVLPPPWALPLELDHLVPSERPAGAAPPPVMCFGSGHADSGGDYWLTTGVARRGLRLDDGTVVVAYHSWAPPQRPESYRNACSRGTTSRDHVLVLARRTGESWAYVTRPANVMGLRYDQLELSQVLTPHREVENPRPPELRLAAGKIVVCREDGLTRVAPGSLEAAKDSPLSHLALRSPLAPYGMLPGLLSLVLALTGLGIVSAKARTLSDDPEVRRAQRGRLAATWGKWTFRVALVTLWISALWAICEAAWGVH